jgi:hypothetical protein
VTRWKFSAALNGMPLGLPGHFSKSGAIVYKRAANQLEDSSDQVFHPAWLDSYPSRPTAREADRPEGSTERGHPDPNKFQTKDKEQGAPRDSA